MKEPLIRKERIRLMIALVLSFILCASVVSAFAADEGIDGAEANRTENAEAEGPEQTDGSIQSEEESDETGDQGQSKSDQELAGEQEQSREEPVVRAAPGLRAANGTVVEFQSKEIAKSRQFWSKDGKYIGCCCQAGTTPAASGTASMSKAANTSLVAKIAYYYGFSRDWVHDYNVISGFQQHTNAARFMYMVQMSQQGVDAWKRWASANNFSQKIQTDAVNCFNTAKSLSITVPDRFECYICTPSNGSQKFILFRYNNEAVPGAVTMQKISGNPDITG